MAENEKLEAATRLEKLLDNIAGGDNEITPATRLEKFLGYIADYVEDISGGSGGGGGSVPIYVTCDNLDSESLVAVGEDNITIKYLNGNDVTYTSAETLYEDLLNGVYIPYIKAGNSLLAPVMVNVLDREIWFRTLPVSNCGKKDITITTNPNYIYNQSIVYSFGVYYNSNDSAWYMSLDNDGSFYGSFGMTYYETR